MRFLTLTMRRSYESIHICVNTDEELIYYYKKYSKQGWTLYSIDDSNRIV